MIDKEPPSAKFRKITQLGLVTVVFSEQMFTPNYDLIAQTQGRFLNTTDSLDDSELTNMQNFWRENKDNILQLTVRETDRYDSERDLHFDWVMLEFTSQIMKIQLQFNDAV